MKKATAPKPAPKAVETTGSAPAQKAAKPAGRAKTSVKAAVSKVTTGAKKAVSKATASVKKSVGGKAVEKVTGAPATIVVRHDAGWGNSIALRGEGPGLSWDSGTPMCCVNGVEWVWVAPTAGTVVFKVLHNDRAWALGENLVAASGETVAVTPVF